MARRPDAERAGRWCLVGAAAVGAGDRGDRHSRDLRRVSVRRHHSARQPHRPATSRTSSKTSSPSCCCRPSSPSPACAPRSAWSAGWQQWLICRLDHRRGHASGKFGGTWPRPALTGLDWRDVGEPGHPDEHARPDGADRAQHRPGPGGHLADAVRHDGADGAGDHDGHLARAALAEGRASKTLITRVAFVFNNAISPQLCLP